VFSAAERRPAVGAAGLGAAGLTAVAVGRLLDDMLPAGLDAVTLAMGVSNTIMAALILYRLPRHRVGLILAAAAGAGWIELVADVASHWVWADWVHQWAWWPPFGLTFQALLVFPDGRLPSPQWRPLATLLVGATAAGTVLLAVAACYDPRNLMNPYMRHPPTANAMFQVAAVFMILACAAMLGVVVAMGVRWRRAEDEVRGQQACLLRGTVAMTLGLILSAVDVPGAWLLTAVAVPISMAVAVLNYRLYGLDTVINRAVVWLIPAVPATVGLVTYLANQYDDLKPYQYLLIAGAVLACSFGGNRLLYGIRHDPFQVLGNLDTLLSRTADPHLALFLLAKTTAEALHLPYLAVEARDGDGHRLLAEFGRATTATEPIDMITRGEPIGRLLTGRRSPTWPLTTPERRLLDQVAQRAAVAVDAGRLIRELRDTREQIVRARAEERRRLHFDLHDGLGPTLQGLSLQVAALRRKVDGPPATQRIIDGIATDLQTGRDEVRRVVEQLQPAALNGGLASALRAECRRCTAPGLTVQDDIDERLGHLPAAVEVAAFRIACEALTNVRRHAHARHCTVRAHRDQSLVLEIIDDGVGIPAAHRDGVGLTSIQERADELGGHCTITPARPAGTSVKVWLPVPEKADR
jgi:signal transduction histidine kinase